MAKLRGHIEYINYEFDEECKKSLYNIFCEFKDLLEKYEGNNAVSEELLTSVEYIHENYKTLI